MEIVKDLKRLKEQLKNFKLSVEDMSSDAKSKNDKLDKTYNCIKYFNTPEEDLLKLNIGGSKFTIDKRHIMRKQNTLLHYLILSNEFDLNEEIFIDRDPQYFYHILNYYDDIHPNFENIKSKQELNLLRREIEFFQLNDLIDYINKELEEVRIVNMSFTGQYIYNGELVGSNILEDVINPDPNLGVCCKCPGNIIFELNKPYKIRALDIAGYKGNPDMWFEENGVNSKISLSIDKVNWVEVGFIPKDFGKSVQHLDIMITLAKFIKFNSSAHIGIGYLKLFKQELIEDIDKE